MICIETDENAMNASRYNQKIRNSVNRQSKSNTTIQTPILESKLSILPKASILKSTSSQIKNSSSTKSSQIKTNMISKYR